MENWQEKSFKQIQSEIEQFSEEEQRDICSILREDSRKTIHAFALRRLKSLDKLSIERQRLDKMWRYEREALTYGYNHVVGTDEVGRGPLAGPVVAAAVVLPRDFEAFGINDSKKLSEKKREELSAYIKEHALAYSIQEVSAEEIDKLNILHAAELAMQKAVDVLPIGDVVFIDGTNRPMVHIPYKNIIKGDSASISIAAASIIAKVYRDHLMIQFDSIYPEYGFAQHKGYGTKEHYDALHKYGPSPIHRRSFRLD